MEYNCGFNSLNFAVWKVAILYVIVIVFKGLTKLLTLTTAVNTNSHWKFNFVAVLVLLTARVV